MATWFFPTPRREAPSCLNLSNTPANIELNPKSVCSTSPILHGHCKNSSYLQQSNWFPAGHKVEKGNSEGPKLCHLRSTLAFGFVLQHTVLKPSLS